MSTYTPSTDQLSSLMAFGQRVAENDRKHRAAALAKRSEEIQRLKDFKRAHPVKPRPVIPTGAKEKQAFAIACAKKGMECVAAKGNLNALAASLGLYRTTLVYYMKSRAGYVPPTAEDNRRVFTPEDRELASELRAKGYTLKAIGKALGCSETTVREHNILGEGIKPRSAHNR